MPKGLVGHPMSRTKTLLHVVHYLTLGTICSCLDFPLVLIASLRHLITPASLSLPDPCCLCQPYKYASSTTVSIHSIAVANWCRPPAMTRPVRQGVCVLRVYSVFNGLIVPSAFRDQQRQVLSETKLSRSPTINGVRVWLHADATTMSFYTTCLNFHRHCKTRSSVSNSQRRVNGEARQWSRESSNLTTIKLVLPQKDMLAVTENRKQKDS